MPQHQGQPGGDSDLLGMLLSQAAAPRQGYGNLIGATSPSSMQPPSSPLLQALQQQPMMNETGPYAFPGRYPQSQWLPPAPLYPSDDDMNTTRR